MLKKNNNLQALRKFTAELASFKSDLDLLNPNVSQWTVGMQIDHIVSGNIKICELLIKSDPKNYKPRFDLSKFVVIKLGYLPRGKGKTPKAALPVDGKSLEELDLDIQKLNFSLDEMEQMANTNSYFVHPLFGSLNKKESIQFMKVHTRHHLKIVNDIIKD